MTERQTERQEELAAQFMAALLARDPLPAQRFTEIDKRRQQLAALSFQVAAVFSSTAELWRESPAKALAAAQRIWDYHAAETKEIPLPAKLVGAEPSSKDRSDLFAGSSRG